MAAAEIISKVNVNNTWLEVQPDEEFRRIYFVAVKDNFNNEAVNVNDVARLICKLGVASGVQNKPITIQTLVFNFRDVEATDNTIATFFAVDGLPKTFYIKPVQYILHNGSLINAGDCAISINTSI